MYYNPVELFGKKPEFIFHDDSICIKVDTWNISKIKSHNLKIKSDDALNFYIQISNKHKIKKDSNIIYKMCKDCPYLTINQFHYYILFCISNRSKHMTYKEFGEYLVSEKICKKIEKIMTHETPQNRYKPHPAAIWAETLLNTKEEESPLLTPKGMDRILTTPEYDFIGLCNRKFNVGDCPIKII